MASDASPEGRWAIAIHGGAGVISGDEAVKTAMRGLEEALEAGAALL
jgi:hypothetical protein